MSETLTDTPPEQRDLTPTAPAQTQSPAPLDYTQLKWPEGTQSAARETFLGAARECISWCARLENLRRKVKRPTETENKKGA